MFEVWCLVFILYCILLYTCANVICIKFLLTYLLTYLFSNHFTTDLLSSLLVKQSLKSVTFGEVTGNKWLTNHLSYAKAFCCSCTIFSYVSQQMCTVILWEFWYGHSVYILVSELNKAKITEEFLTTVLSGWVLHDSLLHTLSSWAWQFFEH